MKIVNSSGRNQEIHYTNETVIVKNGDSHNLDLKKIQRPEMQRLKNVFKFEEEKKPDTTSQPEQRRPGRPPASVNQTNEEDE